MPGARNRGTLVHVCVCERDRQTDSLWEGMTYDLCVTGSV